MKKSKNKYNIDHQRIAELNFLLWYISSLGAFNIHSFSEDDLYIFLDYLEERNHYRGERMKIRCRKVMEELIDMLVNANILNKQEPQNNDIKQA